MKVGAPDDESDITNMCELHGSMHVIKRGGIYRLSLPDEIDPKRTNAALLRTQQQVVAYGCDSEIVVRTLLTANRLFNPRYLGSSFDRKRGLELAFDALRDLISMQEMAVDLEMTQDEAKRKAHDGSERRDSVLLPSVRDVKGRCEAFTQKADHARFALFKIAKLFYDKIDEGVFDGLAKAAEEPHGQDSLLARFVKKVAPFLKFVRRTRNCVEHPKEGQRIDVQDFTLSTEGNVMPPSIEVIDKETPQDRIPVVDFMKNVTEEMTMIFELMIASLCGHNVRAVGGFPIVVGEIPVGQRPACNIRFSYGVYHGGRFVPAL
jgi:hypothetical protein